VKNFIGSFLGHYKILGHLGSGAMSDVYLGFDEDLQIHVAVKVLTDAILERPELVQRFKLEARAAARLNHPNVARVYFFNFKGDTPFFAMEWVEGLSLADVVSRRLRFSLRQYLDIFEQAIRGLRAAAVRGIIHRDIKPGNLMVGADGLVKVVDFGLAKVGDEKGLTTTGTMMGTPYYLSPEAVRGEELDLRADIYSLGVTMFQVLVGYPPYDSDTPFGVMMQHINGPVPDAYDFNDQFPRALCRLIERAMAKERSERIPNHEAILHELARVREGLTERMLDEELRFCGHCDVNTFVRGDHCNRCRNPYVGQEKPEEYDLFLTGFRGRDAEQRCVQYISEAVGRRAEAVEQAVADLPFKLGHKLTFDRAKTMQRRFYELGGDVEMRRVDDENEGEQTDRLEFISAAASRTSSFVAPALAARALKRPKVDQRTAIIVLTGLLVLFGGLLIWQMTKEPGEVLVEPPTPSTVVDGAGSSDRLAGGGDPVVESTLPLAVTVGADVTPATADAVEQAIDAAARSLSEICPWEPAGPVLLNVDPRYAFREAGDPRAWELVLGRPVSLFPAGGLEEQDPDVALVAGHWVARNVVADLAGPEAPPWIALGLAYLTEARSRGLDRGPFVELANEPSHIPVKHWGATPGRNNPGNVARAESMVQYLVERGGGRSFADFLVALRTEPLEQAIEATYGSPAGDVQDSWQMFLKTRYLHLLAP
jgi:hypothetical protein